MRHLLPSFKITFKPILTLSILLIFSSPTYPQQNSKSIDIICKALHEDSLFKEPIDTIIKKFQDRIISHSSYRNAKQYEGNGLTAIKMKMGNSNDLIKIKPFNVRLFDKFVPDTVLFYFNDKKLYKCALHFTSNSINVTDLYNTIAYRLGNTTNASNNGWSGPYWMDTSSDLTLYHNDKNFDEVRLEFETTENQYVEKPLSEDNHAALENQIKINRDGVGKGTFTMTLTHLENIIKSRTTMKKIEQQFSRWVSYGADNKLGYEYNDATKSMSIPLYQLYYESSIRNKDYIFKIEISKNIKNPIQYFQFTTFLNGYDLAMFKRSLIKNGYFLNENLTEIFHKITFQNRVRNLMITMRENLNGSYTIGIR